MKELYLTIIGVSIGIIFFLMVGTAVYYGIQKYDNSCLKEKAEEYCLSLNLTYDSYNYDYIDIFHCNGFIDDRQVGYTTKYNYRFLESEKELCRTKDSWSFKHKELR